VVSGRVQIIYYVLHLYLIHTIAIVAALAFHQPAAWLWHGAIFLLPTPAGYRHGLPFIYAMWFLVVAILYLPCLWFMQFKARHLMDQNTDSINKVTSAITNMQTTLQKQQSDTNNHVDQLSGQLQSLNDSLDELKARLGKVTKQLEDVQATQQSLASQASQQATQAQQQQAQMAVPPPDVLYNN